MGPERSVHIRRCSHLQGVQNERFHCTCISIHSNSICLHHICSVFRWQFGYLCGEPLVITKRTAEHAQYSLDVAVRYILAPQRDSRLQARPQLHRERLQAVLHRSLLPRRLDDARGHRTIAEKVRAPKCRDPLSSWNRYADARCIYVQEQWLAGYPAHCDQ